MTSTSAVVDQARNESSMAGRRMRRIGLCIERALAYVLGIKGGLEASKGHPALPERRHGVASRQRLSPIARSGARMPANRDRSSTSIYKRVVQATPRFSAAAMFPSAIAKAAGVAEATARRHLWDAVEKRDVIPVAQDAYGSRYRFHRETPSEKLRQANQERRRAMRRAVERRARNVQGPLEPSP